MTKQGKRKPPMESVVEASPVVETVESTTPITEMERKPMENATLRVFDKKTKSELTEGLTLVPMNGREHIGRKHVAVRNHLGVPMNVGILNPDGTVEAQPGYRIEISDGVVRNTADSDDE